MPILCKMPGQIVREPFPAPRFRRNVDGLNQDIHFSSNGLMVISVCLPNRMVFRIRERKKEARL